MPHKFFQLYSIKIYTHITLAEALYIKRKHTNTFVNARIHTEITINIYMQHIQEIPIRINKVITAHMITHKNKNVNNNATCKFITERISHGPGNPPLQYPTGLCWPLTKF
jgi:hypothetical protein